MACEQYVIDNEIIGMVKRALKGICVNNETLALQEIQEVGHGGNFISHIHTVNFLRKEFFLPVISDRNERTVWEGLGSFDARERAQNEEKKILSEHQPLSIPKDLDKKIRKKFEIFHKNQSII